MAKKLIGALALALLPCLASAATEDDLGVRGNLSVVGTTNLRGNVTIEGTATVAGATTNAALTSFTTGIAIGADPADAGAIRLSNAGYILSEADAAGTDVSVIGVTSGEIIAIGASGASGVTITPLTTVTGGVIVTPPAAQVVAGGDTIAANACGGLKQLSAGGNVTTATDNTFTAPAAANAGCCMDVVNIDGTDTITLDGNANFLVGGSNTTNVALTPGDAARVCSNGSAWYLITSYLTP